LVRSIRASRPDFFRGLESWARIAGKEAGRPWVVYGGDRRQSRTEVEVLPWRQIGALIEAAVAPPAV
jgi:hypothetical protein